MKNPHLPSVFMLLASGILAVNLQITPAWAESKEILLEKRAKNAQSHEEKLASTYWQGTKVIASDGKDVTALNTGFMSYAKYDVKTNRYEFFDQSTGKSKGDHGIFFITQDGQKRILISQSKAYQAVVDMVSLDEKSFVYARTSKLSATEEGIAKVYHVPYKGILEFTTALAPYSQKTGKIDLSRHGRDILADTVWVGTVAKDAHGNDVSATNKGFLGLAKYDAKTNKYEFFDKTTGESRGDFGYYDVIHDNKARVTVSIGKKYGAVLELTEINKTKFTYARKGKDANGNDIDITVEHVPYTGNLKVAFTF